MWKNCKKVMAGTLSVCMLAACVPGAGDLGSFTQVCKVAQAATKSKYKGTCGKKARWQYNQKTKTLTISGTGAMEDYINLNQPEEDQEFEESRDAPWMYEEGIKPEKIVIGDGITKVGDYAFCDMSSVKEVKLGKKLKKIGKDAFSDCKAIKKVTLGDTVEEIGIGAFSNCESLKEVRTGKNLKKIGRCAFYQCKSLQKVELGKGVREIARYAFYECKALKKIDLGKGVQKIGEHIFEDCKALEQVTLGDDLKEIGESAFYGCKNLKNIYIGKSLEKLGAEAFDGCVGIENVKLHTENEYFTMKNNLLTNKDNTELYLGFFDTDATCNVDASVKKIDKVIIKDKNLEHFEVSSDNPNYYSEDGLLYTKDGSQLLSCPKGKKGTAIVSDKAVIMNFVYHDEEYDWYDKDEDDTEGENEFNIAPFEDCAKLEKIIVGKNIKFLDNWFFGCESLREVEVDVENEYYSSAKGAIFNRDQNKLLYCIVADEDGTYTVPENVTQIAKDAFSCVRGDFEHLVLPDNMVNFEDLPYCISEITLGKKYYNDGNLSWLASEDEYDYEELKKINVSEENPYYSSVDGILYDKNQTTLLVCPRKAKVCNMQNTVTSVNKKAIGKYSALEELYVSDSVKDMTSWFKGRNLQKIHIGKSVQQITPCYAKKLNTITVSSENMNFKINNNILYTKDGKKLVWCPQGIKGTVTIDNGTSVIGTRSFSYTKNVTKLVIPKTVKKIEADAFYGMNAKATIRVPKGQKTYYKKLLTKKTGYKTTMKIE